MAYELREVMTHFSKTGLIHLVHLCFLSKKKKTGVDFEKKYKRNKYLEKKESAIGLLDGMPVGRLQVLRSSVGVYIYTL